MIIHKPGAQNKSNALSQHPDQKEGIAPESNEQVLLDTKLFTVHTVCPTAVTALGDTTLCQTIKSSQEYDTDVSIALEAILKNGRWRMESSCIKDKYTSLRLKNSEEIQSRDIMIM